MHQQRATFNRQTLACGLISTFKELHSFYHKLVTRPMFPAKVFHSSLERLKKYCSHSERGFLGFGEWCRSSAFGEGAGLNNPVTEPKRSQNPKRPLLFLPQPNGYSIYENALVPLFDNNPAIHGLIHDSATCRVVAAAILAAVEPALPARRKKL